MSGQTLIASRFNGPPNSGNGGYSCGVLAAFIDGPASIRLHVPPPLDAPLHVECTDAGDVVGTLGRVWAADNGNDWSLRIEYTHLVWAIPVD